VNGNLGASKSVYFEGDSIPYRMRFGNLSLASHYVDIEWDTTKSGKHALDYITTFNRTVTDANPCVGVAGCSGFTTFPIPADPQNASISQLPGDFRIYGGTITSVSAYSYPNGPGFTGDKSARLRVTFTASVTNPVLAWGGHIATRLDWGTGGSAVAISGSPYHTRLISLDGSGGNQDRSLSAAAVIFPGNITVIKDVNPGTDPQDFSFSTTGLSPATFDLDDDGDNTNTLSNRRDFNTLTNFTTPYTITEAALTGWSLTGLTCVRDPNTANGGSAGTDTGTRTASVSLGEGESWTCTFTNFKQNPHLAITKVATESGFSAKDQIIHYTIVATNDGNVSLTNVTVTDTQVSNLSCTPTVPVASLAPGGTINCTASHTITQADIDAGSFYNQACASDGAGPANSPCAEVTTPGTQNNVLTLTKTDDLKDVNGDPIKYDHLNQVITYTLTATNSGNTTLHNVSVSDSPALVGFSCTPSIPVASLAPGASIVCTGTHSITQADRALRTTRRTPRIPCTVRISRPS
jgi:uncharacterized repeat protein (TIGR01451 family)